ncbi:MAG: hypothetical protein MJY45_01985 [Bacteroidales bacterium]|nr:hypothetical protein [Bacteroidales bacterium]
MRTIDKIKLAVCSAVFVFLAGFVFFRFYFVFGEGVKAGELNQFMLKGWLWKTYEGRIIQSGFKSGGNTGGIHSNEFNFSVVDKAVADSLMGCSGKFVELEYKEYRGALPWRGMEKKIVTGIRSVTNAERTQVIPISE